MRIQNINQSVEFRMNSKQTKFQKSQGFVDDLIVKMMMIHQILQILFITP